MSLPPAPIFDALTTINKKSLDVPGGAPVKVTSLMWMQWFQQLCDYITSIGGGGGGTPASDATVLSFMEQGYEGAVSELEKKLHSLETLIHMGGD